jgi:hypothetical protein
MSKQKGSSVWGFLAAFLVAWALLGTPPALRAATPKPLGLSTPVATSTPTDTPTITNTPTDTPTSTATPTSTPVPATPTLTPTVLPTATATALPVVVAAIPVLDSRGLVLLSVLLCFAGFLLTRFLYGKD